MDVVDFNGDGLIDFVVGKCFWVYGFKGNLELNVLVVIYWFEFKWDVDGVFGGVDFVLYFIYDKLGVGI